MISLSNLFKQHYVVNLENEKRIINADEKYINNNAPVNNPAVSEFSEEISDSEEILDGFLEGLEAEVITVDPQVAAEELLEKAKAEAEAIISAAKADAVRIADDAQKEAEVLFERRKLEGYNSGVAKMKEDLANERAQIQRELDAMKEALKSEYDTKLETMESDIVDAIIMVFNRVFDIQFENKKQILLHLVNTTLMNVEVGKEFHIRVSTANYKFIESHIGDIKEKIGNDISVEIVNDMSLGPEDCIIETESGVFNCGIDMELANLEKDIRALCS